MVEINIYPVVLIDSAGDYMEVPIKCAAVDVPSFGFIGEMASGKSTYSNALRRQIEATFGVKVYRPSFSAKIVDIAVDLYDMDGKNRRMLQDIGDKLREIKATTWADYLIRGISRTRQVPFIVDGIRVPEEAEAFRTAFSPNFVLIRLETDEKQRREAYKLEYERYPTEDEASHSTEQAVSQIKADMVLKNTYKKVDLDVQIAEIVTAIQNGTMDTLLRK
jgi:dephospho-CoA kinase